MLGSSEGEELRQNSAVRYGSRKKGHVVASSQHARHSMLSMPGQPTDICCACCPASDSASAACSLAAARCATSTISCRQRVGKRQLSAGAAAQQMLRRLPPQTNVLAATTTRCKRETLRQHHSPTSSLTSPLAGLTSAMLGSTPFCRRLVRPHTAPEPSTATCTEALLHSSSCVVRSTTLCAPICGSVSGG